MEECIDPLLQAAAVKFITPEGTRKIVRRPKTDAREGQSFVPYKDGKVAIRSWGEGPPVLLVHGWAANQTDFFNYVPALVNHGYRAVVMDLPAHGESTGETASLDQLAEGVLAVGNSLGHLAGLIAHSIGCAASQLAIANGLSLDKAIMLASPHDYELSAHRFAAHRGFDAAQTQEMVKLISEMGVRLSIRSADFVPAFNVPALIVHSDDDSVIPVATAEELSRFWNGSQFLQVSGLGHRGVLRDESLIAQVISFLDSKAS